MKILIIGDPSRKEKDAPLIENAKQLFNRVLYTPVDQLMLKVSGSNVFFKGRDISDFDCALLIPTRKHIDMFLSVAYALKDKVYMPTDFTNFLIFQRTNITNLGRLKKMGFATKNFSYCISEDAAISDRFPIEVIIGDMSAIAHDARELRNVTRFRKSGQCILLREASEHPLIECFVVGNEVIACMEKRDKRNVTIKIGSELQKQIINIVKFSGSGYASVTLYENSIISVTLSPDFKLLEKITGKHVSYSLLRYMKRKVEEKRSVFDSILDFMRRIA